MAYDPFIVRANVARWRKLLEGDADEAKRRMLHRLIAEIETPHAPLAKEPVSS